MGSGSHLQHFATAFVVEIVTVVQYPQALRSCPVKLAAPFKNRPDGGIFRTQAPQGVATRRIGSSLPELIEDRHSIQKPDVMEPLVFVVIVKSRIKFRRIQSNA